MGEDTSIAIRELSWPALSDELQKPQLQTWNFLQELMNKKPALFPPKFTTNRTYKTLAGLHERLVQVIVAEDMRMENLQVAQIMDMCDANTGANEKCFYFCAPALLHGRELREDSMTQIDYLAFIFLCHCARTHNQRTHGTRLLVGWSAHKFHETKTRTDRGPA